MQQEPRPSERRQRPRVASVHAEGGHPGGREKPPDVGCYLSSLGSPPGWDKRLNAAKTGPKISSEPGEVRKCSREKEEQKKATALGLADLTLGNNKLLQQNLLFSPSTLRTN